MTESRTKAPAGNVPHPYWIDGISDPKDGSRLVKRAKLSDLMNYDERASYRHRRLWDFHLGWAHKDYNWTSLASVRRIRTEMLARSPTGKAISLQSIAGGNRDMVEWQYLFEDEKGKGRRGSRYSINWQLLELAANGQFPASVHPVGDATSVHPVGDTTVNHVVDAKAASVHPVGDKDPTTQTRLQDGATSSSNDSAAPATPPHAAGLAPASGEAPQGRASDTVPDTQADVTQAGGFDELWAAYRFKHDRAKAKAAYGKLDPSPELHAELCIGAAAWADHYQANKTEPRWRVRLHNWLAGEKYLEDVPQVYTDAKSAAISQTRGSAKPTKAGTGRATKPGCAFAAGETCITITKADVTETQTSSLLIFYGEDGDGVEYIHSVPLEHHNDEVQAAGQRELGKITDAAGYQFGITDPKELIGRRVVALVDEGELTWHPPRGGQPVAATEPEPVVARPPPQPAPPTRVQPAIQHRSVQIFESDCVDGVVSLLFVRDKDGSEFTHELRLDNQDDLVTLARITKACGHGEIEDTEALHRHPIILHLDGDTIVDAVTNTDAIARRERGVAWIKEQQALGWPDDEKEDGGDDKANAPLPSDDSDTDLDEAA